MNKLNKLNGFTVTNFTIELTPEADGTNMMGTVYIPNPTVMTSSMVPIPSHSLSRLPPNPHPIQGNVTFNNYLHATGTLLGTTALDNLTLCSGNNTLPMRSIINQTLVLEGIINDPKSTLLPVDIVGGSRVYDGLHFELF